MNDYKNYANSGHYEPGKLMTRSVSKHGLNRASRRCKKAANRTGKRKSERWHFSSQED